MDGQRNHLRSVECAPLVMGLVSVLLAGVYLFQRVGRLQPHLAERFVQRHLDLIGGTAAVLALVGIILFFVMPKHYRDSGIFRSGVVVCVFASICGFLSPL